MHASREVIFVQGTEAAVVQYAEQLPSYSFPTKVCNSLHGFRRLSRVHKVFAGIVLGKHPDPAAVTSALRELDQQMWIIYLHPSASAQQRIAALAGGADVCLTDLIEAPELAAALQALVRRGRICAGKSVYAPAHAAVSDAAATASRRRSVGQRMPAERLTKGYGNPSEPRARGPYASVGVGLADVTDAFARRGARPAPSLAPAGWHLVQGGRKLCCRHGLCMPLTPTERIFMACLLDTPDRPVHRSHVADIGNRGADDVASVDSAQRSVDVLVSRLRRKAARCGLILPIKAVRGWGYMFATREHPDAADAASEPEDEAFVPAPCCTHATG